MSAHVIYGDPVGKPRQTRRDRWKIRPCVAQYRAWADLARLTVWGKTHKKTLTKPTMLTVRAFFTPPAKEHRVGPHTVKCDADNILKSVMDALFLNDQMVYKASIEKLWSDGSSPRVEVEIV